MLRRSTADDLQALLAVLEESRVRLGLESMRDLLEALGNPHAGAPAVLIAGTNGKGSTAVHLAAILSAAGTTTGLYTSPHLESATERIRVDGLALDEEALHDLLRRVVDTASAAGVASPTYFEAMTAAAMLHFAEQGVEFAVYEVGLGGRLDATNVVDPVLSVITEIALDHQEMLGDSLPKIAREKAGIQRRGVLCCHWIGDAEARVAVEEVAAELGAPTLDVRASVGALAAAPDEATEEVERLRVSGRELVVSAPGRGGGLPRLANLSLALVAAEELTRALRERKPESGPSISAELVERAWEACRWPGRWESVERPDGGSLLLDGAHNLHGLESLLSTLGERSFVALFGALGDKQPQRMASSLACRARAVVLTRPDSDRAADPRELAATTSAIRTEVEEQPAEALRTALDLVEEDELLLVCGSLYLVGEVRTLLRKWWGRPQGLERIYGGEP